ncbi:MAG: hypothetical protein HeimC2_19390 [Candidatus Heimdallarchaeota archaeon LC_2]|nr:MAG: hypothetical protein HeimC2_19390 [Candidatus Heimdallarchaeota archaeon LC_2]
MRDPREATQLLDKNDEIVVYCSSKECVASQLAYHISIKNGYTNVRRYSGGIIDWEEAGFPLEGEMVY